MDDIPRADEIRTLVKDIWDVRVAKLRSSVDTFVRSDSAHAMVCMLKNINLNLKNTAFMSLFLPFDIIVPFFSFFS